MLRMTEEAGTWSRGIELSGVCCCNAIAVEVVRRVIIVRRIPQIADHWNVQTVESSRLPVDIITSVVGSPLLLEQAVGTCVEDASLMMASAMGLINAEETLPVALSHLGSSAMLDLYCLQRL